jgi:nucleoside-diphosphate-sugar epimerase
MTADVILVTGASGFLGSALVDRLLRSSRNVRAAVRAQASVISGNAEKLVIGDLAEAADWAQALQGVDAIIHVAGRAHVLKETAKNPLELFRVVNRDATLALARAAAAAGVRRFIFISSIGVNGGETHGRGFCAEDPPAPHSDYAIAKWEAEEGLAAIGCDSAMEIVVIRPPLILGKDPKGNLATLNRAIDMGLPLPFGLAVRNRRDFVSRANLVNLIELTIDHPAAAGQTFLASDGQAISTRTLVEHLARLRGRKTILLPIPAFLLSLLLNLLRRRAMASQLLGDLEIDIGHTRKQLGWQPTPMNQLPEN